MKHLFRKNSNNSAAEPQDSPAAPQELPTPESFSGEPGPAASADNAAPMTPEEELRALSEELAEEPPVQRHLPRACYILYGLALISAIIEIICLCSESFADFFNLRVACYSRMALAWLTAWIPFSLGEMLLLLLPLILVALTMIANRKYAESWRNVGIFCLMMLSVLSVFFTLYVFTLGTGYRGSTLDKKLELERKEVSSEGLYVTADLMVEKVREFSPQVAYGADGFSVMPYNYSEMTDRLLDAFDKAAEDYDFIVNFRCPVKTVMHSEPWTYTHITGVYSYFTGESNININMPDYTIPFTAAHELAHQRGITREDEANFVAYLVCTASDDPYIQYSGYLNMFEYLSGPLYSAAPGLYGTVYGRLPAAVKIEENAYNHFFEKYRETVVSTVSEAVNDTYLKINGTEGTRSYGMVVDLCVAYYADK